MVPNLLDVITMETVSAKLDFLGASVHLVQLDSVEKYAKFALKDFSTTLNVKVGILKGILKVPLILAFDTDRMQL